MGNYPTLSHIGATYNFMSATVNKNFSFFADFCRF